MLHSPTGSENGSDRGFTLIELAVVLVIIGLIVGGVLVGQDLVRAAGERAQISQIEKFNAAANTFYGKYGYLPGDIPDPTASSFGFAARGLNPGEGNGDGVLKGIGNPTSNWCGFCEGGGETGMFWSDLTYANGMNIGMIEGSFSLASPTANPASSQTGTAINRYIPAAKIGGGNAVYVWSGGPTINFPGPGDGNNNGLNYYGLSNVTQLSDGGSNPWKLTSKPGLSVKQAYDIDSKVDDGLPQSGRVTAVYMAGYLAATWAAGGGNSGANAGGLPTTTATSGSSTTCYDNGSVTGATQQYSVEISNGSNVNCALSFRFQ